MEKQRIIEKWAKKKFAEPTLKQRHGQGIIGELVKSMMKEQIFGAHLRRESITRHSIFFFIGLL
jgi:hypothetical protein